MTHPSAGKSFVPRSLNNDDPVNFMTDAEYAQHVNLNIIYGCKIIRSAFLGSGDAGSYPTTLSQRSDWKCAYCGFMAEGIKCKCCGAHRK